MDNNIIATMEAEEADLARKLEAVRQFLDAYRGGVASKSTPAPKASVSGTARGGRSTATRLDKFGPYGQRIVDFADSVLPGCVSNPVPTRQLVEYLESQGINITGDNKVNSLSALLARSSKMKGWGRAGWTRMSPDDGDRLKQMQGENARNENGEAEASPDAEGAATPSTDSREDFDHLHS